VQRCPGASCTNFAQIGVSATTTYPDTGLSSGSTYRYQVQAVDTAANASPFSNIASATTSSSPYTTNFPLTESPISESGHWINGGTVGLDWGNVQTVAGTAEGVGPAWTAYSDPTAILTGTWGPNQTVTATVFSNGVEDKPTTGYDKEVEIRLRSSISAHMITGYEINCRTPNDSLSYIQIVRWNGALGSFTSLNIMYGTGCGNGDVLKATISGTTISVYRNGTLMLTATDSTYATGNPGIGFNFGCGTEYNQFGFTSFTATDGSGTAP
jgi:hypothetical protein